jgi:tRNA (guanine-N7-)-methyltransferase
MSKNKLKKFAEMETFHNVFQCGAQEVETSAVLAMAGHWRDNYFKNDNPIVLELGCGRGEYTVGLAKRNPDKNYIGIDIKGARMWAGAKQAETEGISNVAFLRKAFGKPRSRYC